MKPVLVALLLADKVFREMETGKVHVAGVFNQINSNKIPVMVPTFSIYFAITDLLEGNHKLDLEIRYMESGTRLVKLDREFRSPGPLEVLEMNFCLNMVNFTEEGSVELILSVGGEIIGNRVLRIRKVDGNAPPFFGGIPPSGGGQPTFNGGPSDMPTGF